MTVYIFGVGVMGLRQQEPAITLNTPEEAKQSPEKVVYAKSGLSEENIKIIAADLENIMKTNKPYLNRELSLTMLASHVAVTPANLSQVINQYYKINFFDYVNRYRIEEFKDRVSKEEYKAYSVSGLAWECGFKSKSSFYKVFKKITGENLSNFKQ
jgi:YesN/AraC family two-component response regulator